MSDSNRLRVLAEVNAVLKSEGLAPWSDLKRIGKHREKKEFEITGVSHVIRDLKQYYVIIVFNVLRPDGSAGQYGVRATNRIPAVIVAIVNGKVLCVKQHRLGVGRWMTELPRGWIDPAVVHKFEHGVAQALLEREVGAEWIATLDRFNPILLGSVWEDTGTRMDQVQLYLVEAAAPSDPPNRKDYVSSKLYSWDQIDDMVDGDIINDQTTLMALFKTKRFLERRSA